MDLSKNPETDSTSEVDDEEDDDDDDDDDDMETADENASSENDNNNPKSIPSSFSIRNLSKPHNSAETVAGQASATTTTQGLTQGQVSEMREYAMNTMRELLGIYGLTSEVAESISRQLPIAAFSSGEL